ncbi:MAG: helix-turn-helix domain-containing protein [Ruminococcaceae bacterium]|nr:helix-turn-helix domain-containing protein [Oscillospiraceae bacterium]
MRKYLTKDYIQEGNSVHIFSSTKRVIREAEHTHDFIEIIYISAGKCMQTINGVDYNVKHGDILFINYGSTHSFECDDSFSYVNICFSPETLGDKLVTSDNAFSLLCLTAFDEMRNDANGGVISFFGNERKEIENILYAMISESKEKQPSWGRVTENYLNILVTKMLRKTQRALQTQSVNNVWEELSEYIDKNLGGELTLSSLAGKCFYNPSYFSRMFKEKFGTSLVEYVTRKRLDYAIELLGISELSIEEICERAGFSDRSSFYYAFSKYVGSTPSEYRNEKVKKSDK